MIFIHKWKNCIPLEQNKIIIQEYVLIKIINKFMKAKNFGHS